MDTRDHTTVSDHRRRAGATIDHGAQSAPNLMDEDLESLNRAALIAEVKRLRAAIRQHRDSSGHELCWHHPDMWSLLPEGASAFPAVPDWPQFLRGCIKYRQSLDRELPDAPRIKEEL
jgi:hypothetical protein